MSAGMPAQVAAFDQALAAANADLDRWVATFQTGAGQFDQVTNVLALVRVLIDQDPIQVASMLGAAINRLAESDVTR